MTPIQTTKMSNFRWVICALLFLATTVNYMDRQVLSLTWKDFIAVDFHWTDADYGKITGLFSLFYAIANLFSGKFIDWMGTKKGYLIAIFVWSTGAVMHAGCGWVAMNIEGYGQQRQSGYGQRPQQGEYGQSRGYGQRPQQGFNKPYGAPYKKRQHTADYDPNAKYSMKKRIEYKEINYDPNEPLRLNKFLANAGICSRREADEFIQAGVVTVNGQVVTELGTKILRTDEVMFHDQPVKIEKKVYVLLNKPKDYVTTSDDPQQRKTVMDLVKNACPERIYPVGRLDRNTTGVLLLTNDGDLASKLTHPKYLKKKIYHVYLDKNVTAHDLQQIADGIQLEDGEIKADDVQYASPTDKKQVGIEIHSGKNRIVRRIFESLGYRVQKLDRVQFAGLTKKNLKRGDWRYLTEEEVDRLRMGAYE